MLGLLKSKCGNKVARAIAKIIRDDGICLKKFADRQKKGNFTMPTGRNS